MLSVFETPLKDGWVKYFLDGTIEFGYDQEVDNKKISWTKGKQDGIAAVALKAGDIVVYLITEDGEKGKFWQSDDYEVRLGNRNPVRTTRRIEQKVGDKTWKIMEIDLKTQVLREFTSKYKI